LIAAPATRPQESFGPGIQEQARASFMRLGRPVDRTTAALHRRRRGDIMEFTSGDGPQHVRALERANHVRSARALVKRRIASGNLTAAEVILSHRWEIATMPITEILISQRQWGRGRCHRFLLRLTMREDKQIGSMTERQRTAVAALLTTQWRSISESRSPVKRPRN
jgi:hypothetical protein